MTQWLGVQMRISLRHLDRRVSQKVTDDRERNTAADECAREGVPIWATENVHPLTASPEQCRRIYSEGLSAALRCARDSDVVIDCTSRSAAFRTVAMNLLRSHGCQVVFVDCVLPLKTARARVIERLLSDPTHLGRGSRHFDTVAASFEPLSEAEFAAAPAVRLDTGSQCPKVWSRNAPGPFDEEACDVIIRVLAAPASCNVGRDHERENPPVIEHPGDRLPVGTHRSFLAYRDRTTLNHQAHAHLDHAD